MEEEKAGGSKMPKVYSPDITPYSFEGKSYFFGTLLSIIVAPIRLLSRVMHNIFILPANLQKGYAQSLIWVSGALIGIGVLDLLIYRKWPLVVSAIPALIYGLRLKRQALDSEVVARELRHIEIDDEQVEEAANSVYTSLQEILKDGDKDEDNC